MIGSERTPAWGERGVALAVALFSLVVVGALVAGTAFLAMADRRVGRHLQSYRHAALAADHGAYRTVSDWDVGRYNSLWPADSVLISGTLPGGRAVYRGSVRRLTATLFLIHSKGRSLLDGGRHEVGLLARLRPLPVEPRAALTALGPTILGPSVTISGEDFVPLGWSCPAPQPPFPGLLRSDSAGLDLVCPDTSCVIGTPPVLIDPALNDSTLLTYGDLSWAELASQATVRLGSGTWLVEPVSSAGRCDINVPTNWGDPDQPAAACGSYFPLIHLEGDATLTGRAGQGVLMVEGDLRITGGFRFFGAVLVRGRVTSSGSGGIVTGGMVVIDRARAENRLDGPTLIRRSSCVLGRALLGGGFGEIIPERGWFPRY